MSRWLATAMCACAIIGPVSAASGAQQWHRIASGGMNVSDQVGLARTSDGVLHIVWRRQRAGGQDLLHTTITAAGAVGATTTVLSGWASLGSPALVANGRNLSVFFPGTQTLVTGDPSFGLDSASSEDGGRSWSISATAIASGDFAASRTPAAIRSERGYFLQAWYGAGQTVVHSGLNPAVPAVAGYGQGTDQALAGSNFDQAMVGWCTELQATTGVFVARVDPATGARAGEVIHLPDSGRCPADTRVALVGSPDRPERIATGLSTSDFFIATSSVSGRTVRVYEINREDKIAWRSIVAAGSSFKQQIALATTPRLDGLWAAWRDSDSDKVVVRRLPSGIDWDTPLAMALPRGQSLSQLALDAQKDRVDVIATTSDDNNVVSLYTTQAFPTLTLEGGRGGFKVLEATNPVARATVRVAGRTFVTNAGGAVRIRPMLAAGSYTAIASKAGYVSATLRFRVP